MSKNVILSNSLGNDGERETHNCPCYYILSSSIHQLISSIDDIKSELSKQRANLSDLLDDNLPRALVADRGNDLLNLVRSEIRRAASKNSLFPKVMAGDPAWSILLDLFEAKMTGKSRVIKSVCLASGVPATTALRYLDLLVCEGYVERSFDPADGRRVLVSLTSLANDRMVTFFMSRL